MSGAAPTTAPITKVATGTSTKTLLQLVHASAQITVVEWGISFDGTAAATPIQCELIQTTTVAATVTAYGTNDVVSFSNLTGNSSGVTISSTTGSGFNATAEGTVVAPVRVGDYQLVAPTNQYLKQFPLDQEFVVPSTGIMRIRVTAGTTVNAVAYCVFAIG